MKNIYLAFMVLLTANVARAQVTSLDENFDESCPTFTAFPATWFVYNTIPVTTASGAWKCAPLNGRNGTPGMDCTGYFNGIFNIDTSYLISPQLDLSGYLGQHIYLHFDSRTSQLDAGGKLAVIASNTTNTSGVAGPETFLTYIDLSADISPDFGSNDSSGWVTHEVDLTGFETAGDFFIAFRYTSTDTSGSIWFLDNIITSTTGLQVPLIANDRLPLTVLGASSSTQITIGYNVPQTGNYCLSIFDMQGRELCKENLNAVTGIAVYTISDLNLNPGMYLVKMGNGMTDGTTRVIIP